MFFTSTFYLLQGLPHNAFIYINSRKNYPFVEVYSLGVMLVDFILSFLENIIIVIGIASSGSYIGSKYLKHRNLVWGVLLGIGSIFIMKNSILIEPGRFVDFRYLSMTLAGFFGGLVPAMIAACIIGFYRWLQGGEGAWTGVITIFIFGIIGFYLRKFRIQNWGFKEHALLGGSLTTVVILIMLIVPPWNGAALHVATKVAVPLFLLVPIGSYICFKIFFILQDAIENQMLLREEIRLLDLDPETTIIRSMEGKITFWNRKAEELYGYTKDEVIGNCMQDILLPQFPKPFEQINQILLSKGRWEGELIHTRKDGSKIICRSCWLLKNTSGSFSVMELNLNITETKRMEEELTRLETLNTVGEMAAGISHEVRNPMTTVRGYLQLFLRKEAFKDYGKQIQTMIDELDRANSIITEFLSLAKDKVSEIKADSLNEIIHVLSPLLQAEAYRMGHEIEFKTSDIPDIPMDKNEIRQLILNLTRNGFEAMASSGKLIIQTYLEKQNVVLRIQDTGTGIPEEVLRKLGTPFLTTKENGTGLGLSVCYRIAQSHNAKITANSSPEGTTFFIKFSTL